MQNNVEPPSRSAMQIFMIGQDSRGNWVVQDQAGERGGLFVDRIEALRYIRLETGNPEQTLVMPAGNLELDMGPKPRLPQQQHFSVGAERERQGRLYG